MASKDGNGLLISHAIFALLSVGLGVAWYFAWQQSSDLQRQFDSAKKAESEAKGAIVNVQGEVTSLRDLVGRTATGAADDTVNRAVTESQAQINSLAADGSSSGKSLEGAMISNAVDREIQSAANTDRQVQLAAKTKELEDIVASQTKVIAGVQATLAEKDQELTEKERMHSEQLAQRTRQFDEIAAQLLQVETTFSNVQDAHRNEMLVLDDEKTNNTKALKSLRKAKMEIEDLKFERPDGSLLFVDQQSQLCTIDVGSADNVLVGMTFSVYAKDNGGVGRRQGDGDIKGKIEVVELVGSHEAKARIVKQKRNDPPAAGDPIYSPLFWPGQKIQIAVVGLLDFDGNPGTDREEFNQIVRTSGAEVVLHVNDLGKLIGKDGAELTTSDIPNNLSSSVRFLVRGNLGDENTQDSAQQAIYMKIRELALELDDEAKGNGVYVMELDKFLEYVGYTSKRLVYSPTRDYPANLPNGAKSLTVTGTRDSFEDVGTSSSTNFTKPMVSLGHTAFSPRRKKATISSGQTTKLYATPGKAE
jgi:hypothetical protein